MEMWNVDGIACSIFDEKCLESYLFKMRDASYRMNVIQNLLLMNEQLEQIMLESLDDSSV